MHRFRGPGWRVHAFQYLPVAILATAADGPLRTRVLFVSLAGRRPRLDISVHVESRLEIVRRLRVGVRRRRVPSHLGGCGRLARRVLPDRLSSVEQAIIRQSHNTCN